MRRSKSIVRISNISEDDARVVYLDLLNIQDNEKWTHILSEVPGSPAKTPKTTDDTGLSAPTVHCNGISVFAIFGNGDLVSLTLTGDKIWSQSYPASTRALDAAAYAPSYRP